MSKIQNNSVATIAYVLKNRKGEILDQAGAEDAFAYLHGHDNIVPGLEKALLGLTVGDKASVSVSADEGYGDYDPELVQQVEKSKFPPKMRSVKPGEMLQVDTGDGWSVVTVKEVSATHITIDGNHELAGEDLFFEVEVVGLREASAEEIEHGHAHGPEGHHHH
ncbi:MAG: hypothetical protein RL318_61 [Fibrobacterota bacterium]|jgi:FKBP-type peptidyl-prolyl cis-trans isomerase SlyD